MNTSALRPWFKLVLGVGLLLTLFSLVDWRRGAALLLQANLWLSTLAALLVPLSIFLSSWKWELFLKAQGLRFSQWRLFRCYWIGFFFNNFFPSNVGGDLVRIAMLKSSGRWAEVSASVLVERLTGLALLLVLCACGLACRPEYFSLPGLFPLLWWAVGLGLLAVVCLVFFPRFVALRLQGLGRGGDRLVGKLLTKLRQLVGALGVFRGQRRLLALAMGASFIFYVVTALFHFLVFQALGLEMPFREVWFIFPLITLAGLIPLAFNSLGIAEGAFVLFYSQAGVAPAEALAAAVLARLLGVAVSSLGGVLYLSERQAPKVDPLR